MKKVFILIIVEVTIHLAKGLECWTCDNQPSMFNCMFDGELKTCQSNQMSCKTEVRRYGPRFSVTKGCKQTQACRANAKIQVTPDANGLTECNNNRESSVCTCCCEGEKCNLNSNPCNGMEFDCEPRGTAPNVEITCSNGSFTGSVCSYTCTRPDEFPYPTTSSRCLNYGQWSSGLPCCAKMCPPFLLNDILFMRHTSSVNAWEKFLSELTNVAARYNFGNDSLHAGVLSYGSDVHTGNDESIFLDESAAQSRQAFNAKVATLSFVNDTDEINTGAALFFALEEYFTINRGDRLNARNVIVLQVDDLSTDNVTDVAEILRGEGFVIYVIASITNTNEQYTRQLFDLAGSPGNIIFDDSISGTGFFAELVASLCRNPCSNELLPLLTALRPGQPATV